MEEKFVGTLDSLELHPKYATLFRECVVDLLKTKWSDVEESIRIQRISLNQLHERKQGLFEAYVFEKGIGRDVFEQQEVKLKDEIALAEMDLCQIRLDELDVEAVLSFAEYLLSNLSRLWIELALDQKQRLQKIIFPNGITFLDGEFGTAETSPIFNLLGEISEGKSSLVAPTGFEPVLPA